MHFFTSVTTCYIPKARVLAKTLKEHNPDAIMHLVISDDLPKNFDIKNEMFDFVKKLVSDFNDYSELVALNYAHSRSITVESIINSNLYKEMLNGFKNNILVSELCKRCGYCTRFKKGDKNANYKGN